jgi:hypothetical protein
MNSLLMQNGRKPVYTLDGEDNTQDEQETDEHQELVNGINDFHLCSQ